LNKHIDKKFTQSLTTTLLLVTLMVPMSLYSSITSGSEKAFAVEYDKSQVSSEINDCGNGQFPLSVLCQNLNAEVQGNENAVNVIGHQTSSMNGQSTGSVLKVTKIVLCPEGIACPTPSDFTLSVSGNNPSPGSFPGSAEGTFVRLDPGMYSVSEKSPSNPPELTLNTSFSPGCSGTIDSRESLTCTIINQYSIFECGPIQNLSQNEGISEFPQIAVSGNNVYVVWGDTNDTTGSMDLFFRKSTDGGTTFGPTQVLMENAPGDSLVLPQVAASANNVYVVWMNGSPQEGASMLFRKSADAGMTFGPVIELSGTAPFSFTPPQIIASGNNVYVAWNDNTNTFFARSTDAGASFEPVSIADAGSVPGEFVKMAASGNNVALVWHSLPVSVPGDIDILFALSTDGGATFGPVKNLTESSGDRNTNPDVALSGNDVYVVWQHSNGKTDVAFTRSTDAGASFETIKILSQDNPDAFAPEIVVVGTNVYVAWGGADTFFTRSTDAGASFDAVMNLSNNGGDFNHGNLRLGVSGNNLYVVWVDDSLGDRSVFLARSTDAGINFEPVKNISEGIEDSHSPNIAVSDNNLFVVWQSSNDIFYSRCTER
jgi:hypothetical protein